MIEMLLALILFVLVSKFYPKIVKGVWLIFMYLLMGVGLVAAYFYVSSLDFQGYVHSLTITINDFFSNNCRYVIMLGLYLIYSVNKNSKSSKPNADKDLSVIDCGETKPILVYKNVDILKWLKIGSFCIAISIIMLAVFQSF